MNALKVQNGMGGKNKINRIRITGCKLPDWSSRNRWEILNMYKTKYIAEINAAKDTEGGTKNKEKDQGMADIDDITAIIHFLNVEWFFIILTIIFNNLQW